MSRRSAPTCPEPPGIPRDIALLFLTRFLRLFAFGLLSVVVALYLAELGLGPAWIGALLTAALVGDTLLSLAMTINADRLGRRWMLGAAALLMALSGGLLSAGDSPALLLVAVTIGILSPSGSEVGPFLAIEQAILAGFLPPERRTAALAWYSLTGSLGTGLGAFAGGGLVSWQQQHGLEGAAAFQPVLWSYAALGIVLAVCFALFSAAVEAGNGPGQRRPARWGLHQSRSTVWKLSGLFALDAFGGGLVIQSVLAYWLHLQLGATPAQLGLLFLGCNLLAGLSQLAAGWLAHRIGLLNTMVFTHLPANLLLMLVPWMPNLAAASALLLLRSLVTQMDVPTRQAYLLAVVQPDERAAAGGITGVARSISAALSPPITLVLAGSALWAGAPFVLGGAIKVAYDLMLFASFRRLKPEHELPPGATKK